MYEIALENVTINSSGIKTHLNLTRSLGMPSNPFFLPLNSVEESKPFYCCPCAHWEDLPSIPVLKQRLEVRGNLSKILREQCLDSHSKTVKFCLFLGDNCKKKIKFPSLLVLVILRTHIS